MANNTVWQDIPYINDKVEMQDGAYWIVAATLGVKVDRDEEIRFQCIVTDGHGDCREAQLIQHDDDNYDWQECVVND